MSQVRSYPQNAMRKTSWTTWAVAFLLVGWVAFTAVQMSRRGGHISALNRQCHANMMAIVRGLDAYARAHDGVYPPTLDTLVDSGAVAAGDLVCPHTGSRYRYIGGQPVDDDASVCLLLIDPLPNSHSAAYYVDTSNHAIGDLGKAMAFTLAHVTAYDQRISRDCGLELSRDAAHAWIVRTANGGAAPPDAAQVACLEGALARLVAENTMERKCRAKWAEIVANNGARFTPDGHRLFHLANGRICWPKTSLDAPAQLAAPEHAVEFSEFVKALPEQEREAAWRIIEVSARRGKNAPASEQREPPNGDAAP